MSRRFLILSDSLALARSSPESLVLEETWPFLLRAFFDGDVFFQCSWGGATSADLLSQSEYWLLSRQSPRFLIVQVGIVDCAPRAFARNEIFFQRALAAFTRLFPRVGRWFFLALRRYRKISYVSNHSFRDNVRALNKLAQMHGCSLIWLPVLGAGFYEGILPGVSQKIAQANQILREELADSVLDVHLSDDSFMSDGHHLRPEGHRLLAKKIWNRIQEEQR